MDVAVDLVGFSFFASLGTELRARNKNGMIVTIRCELKRFYSPEKEHLIRAVIFTVELNEIFESGRGFQLLLRCRWVALLVVVSIVV